MTWESVDEKPPDSPLSSGQLYAVAGELATGAQLILTGLREAAYTNGDAHEHVALLLLSQGYERLLKLAVCLYGLEVTGLLPDIRRYGHRIGQLLDVLMPALEASGDSGVEEDLEAFRAHPLYAHLLDALDAWGVGGRYFELDGLISDSFEKPQDRFADPRSTLREIGLAVAMTSKSLDPLPEVNSPDEFQGAIEPVRRQVVAFLQLPARLVARGFESGAFGSLAAYFSSSLRPFLSEGRHGLASISDSHEVEYGSVHDGFFGRMPEDY